jgi:hypothetical protein
MVQIHLDLEELELQTQSLAHRLLMLVEEVVATLSLLRLAEHLALVGLVEVELEVLTVPMVLTERQTWGEVVVVLVLVLQQEEMEGMVW